MILAPGGRNSDEPVRARSLLESLRFRLRGKTEMQNVFILLMASVLRLLRGCFRQIAGLFVLSRARAGRFGLGAFPLSVDLDSARLDAVSRSLWWGSGIPIPEPARTAGSRLIARRRDMRWRGGGPEPGHWDA